MLENLLQLYQYDFSEIEDGSVGSDGRYHYISVDEFWAEPEPHAYLFRLDGEIAGLGLVCREPSHRVPGDVVWWMYEFFVMRKFRRTGVGSRAARTIFELHPGTWELDETPHNSAATVFWRRVIKDHCGRFDDFDRVDDHGPFPGLPRPTQRFVVEGRSTQ